MGVQVSSNSKTGQVAFFNFQNHLNYLTTLIRSVFKTVSSLFFRNKPSKHLIRFFKKYIYLQASNNSKKNLKKLNLSSHPHLGSPGKASEPSTPLILFWFQPISQQLQRPRNRHVGRCALQASKKKRDQIRQLEENGHAIVAFSSWPPHHLTAN